MTTCLASFVREKCRDRLRAYENLRDDVAEHANIEKMVLSGGYAYRQIYELIQNAADAIFEAGDKKGRIHVKLAPDKLEVANTGAALDKDGIRTLLQTHSSSKRGDQIGRFGIGFKSLLDLEGNIDIISRSIGLRFDPEANRQRIRSHLNLPSDAPAPGMRLAEVIDPNRKGSLLSDGHEYSWATTVVSATINKKYIFDHLVNEVKYFPPEFLLFLPADIELDIDFKGGVARHITRKRIKNGVSFVSDGTNGTRWKLFETRLKITDPAAISDATHIQSRDNIPLAWAVPIGLGGREPAGYFWAFFPTKTPNLTFGILNAPWKTNSDRTNLVPGKWNDAIMEAAAELIVTHLPDLATPKDYGAPVSAFPRQLKGEELATPLVRSLWSKILDSPVIPATDKSIRKPGEINQHFIKDADICRQWAKLAKTKKQKLYVHPDCYEFRDRASRLGALQIEAKRRENDVLREISIENWLEPLASTNAEHTKRMLLLVGQLLENKYDHRIYGIPDVPLIPVVGGKLASPSEAVITNGLPAPAGFTAVAKKVAQDKVSRKILLEQFGLKEISDKSWNESIRLSFGKAKEGNKPQVWDDLWRNLSRAPRDAVLSFFSRSDSDRLKYRTLSGSWVERNRLIVVESNDEIPSEIVLDLSYIRELGIELPKERLSKFPSADEMLYTDSGELNWYLNQVDGAFGKTCEERTGRKPRKWPQIRGGVQLPAGWRLLNRLPDELTCQLTERMLDRVSKQEQSSYSVMLTHPSSASSYPPVSAPHPLWFWLHDHGRIRIGNWIIGLKPFRSNLVRILADAKVPGFDLIVDFFAARDEETDIREKLEWNNMVFTDTGYELLWKAVFETIEDYDSNFSGLHELWDTAHSFGAVPSKVPTSEGPAPLDEIYVTMDETIEFDPDDGRIVLLSPECADEWIKAGAKTLPTEASINFRKKLSEPAHLLDLFPELGTLDALSEKLADLRAVWVEALEEEIGPRKREAVVVMDADGAIILDRPRFKSIGWPEGIALLLRCLGRHNLLPDDDYNFDDLLEKVRDRRTEEARRKVREQSTLEERLLLAVGNDANVLLSSLPSASRQALGGQIKPREIAEVTLAVYGPATLNRLRDALDTQGLAPPGRWGGERARTFVLDLGFPIEYASTVGARREAEFSVSGPIDLPELHDYQQEILDDIERLIASGIGRRRAVISLPTGGGKTRVAVEAVVRHVLRGDGRRSVLWVAQTDELCEQAVQCFRQLWVNIGEPGEDLRIVRLWGGQRNPSPSEEDNAVAVIASIQTLSNRSGQIDLDWVTKAGIIVIDECHHAIAPSYTGLLQWLDIQVGSERSREREAPVIGLSATPWRGYDEEESQRLAKRFDQRWFPADQAELHKKLSGMGVLSERNYTPLPYDYPVKLTLSEQRHVDTFGEFPESLIERIGSDNDRNELIVDAVLGSSAKSILLFANSVAHAQYLATRLYRKGCSAAAVSGQTDRLARQHFTRKFREGEIRVICNHSVLTTGFDAPKSDMILISRPVLSPVLYMQMVGRGLRGPKNGGTQHCEIATVEDNIENFRDRLAYHFCRRFFENDPPT